MAGRAGEGEVREGKGKGVCPSPYLSSGVVVGVGGGLGRKPNIVLGRLRGLPPRHCVGDV